MRLLFLPLLALTLTAALAPAAGAVEAWACVVVAVHPVFSAVECTPVVGASPKVNLYCDLVWLTLAGTTEVDVLAYACTSR